MFVFFLVFYLFFFLFFFFLLLCSLRTADRIGRWKRLLVKRGASRLLIRLLLKCSTVHIG